MIDIGKEANAFASWPAQERLHALKRIIPRHGWRGPGPYRPRSLLSGHRLQGRVEPTVGEAGPQA